MKQPLVSVVICTYNGEQFVQQQMESILHQTYTHMEIIVCDDASSDNTATILKKYELDPRVKIIVNEKNVGFARNFESAAKLATGEYIAFSDQDDIFVPHKMQRLVDTIGSHALVYSDSELIDEHGNSLHKKLSDVRKLQDSNDSRNFFMINAVSGHTMMIKRELLDVGLPIPEGCYHDWWLALQAANTTGIKYLHETLSYYRQHQQTVTKTLGKKNVPSRKMKKRYEDFVYDQIWLTAINKNAHEKHPDFARRLQQLFMTKGEGRFSWSLFFFLLQHQNIVFTFWQKKFVSRLIEIRKIARGEVGEV